MPMYEYVCAQCCSRFTQLQPMSAPREGHECPQCGSKQTRRVMSTFATTGTGSSLGGGCGSASSPFR